MALLGRAALAGRALAAVTAAALALCPAGLATAQGALEYAVKANYLYKFGPFVDWPAAVFASPSAPFNVCIVGEDPFGAPLDEATRGQTVAGHPVAIHRLRMMTASAGCHVLYVGRSRGQKPAEILQLVRETPVLTVTDERQGVAGGIVQFVLKDGRVRFTVNTEAAQTSGLTISSKLLGLAIPAQKPGG